MYVNDRDQINYHGFLKALREMQGANLRQVAEGICSDSEVSRTEIGDRLPEKLMRDRITSRLGVSGEEYEEYLRPEEYRQWQIRMFILDHINKGDVNEVEKGINEYDKIIDKNPVQEQFGDTMRYMLAQMKGASEGVFRALIELAVSHTVPDIDAAFRGVQLLADQELNLIAEYTHKREYDGAEDEFAWRLSEYLKILKYVDNSYMDTIGRSKIYPRTTCFICEWVFNHKPKKKDLELALELCTKSIELLRDASRLYYFVELLEYRREIITRLLKFKMDDTRRDELAAIYDKDGEWVILFKELYTEYDVPIYMPNFTYLYVETECNSAVDVIRTRRTMLKLSRVKVCDNICTEKTVERFENYLHSPSIVIIRDIFDRIGLCAEYKRASVLTDNVDLLTTYNKLINSMGAMENEKIILYLNILKEQLHTEIPYNMQEIKRIENLLAIREKEVEEGEMSQRIVSALECTVPMEAIVRNNAKYLTRAEWCCMYDLSVKVENQFSGLCMELIKKFCLPFVEGEYESARECTFELLVSGIANYEGEHGEHKNSIELSRKLLKESLRHRRSVVLTDNLYNIIWNYEKLLLIEAIPENAFDIKYALGNCIILSELKREKQWVNFFQNKLTNLRN